MIICSATSGTCLPPFRLDNFYKDGYDCMLDGYKMSLEKTEEIGREEINKHKIYIKFGCNEDHSNKTPASYIIIK
jgi:hypothetical protein